MKTKENSYIYPLFYFVSQSSWLKLDHPNEVREKREREASEDVFDAINPKNRKLEKKQNKRSSKKTKKKQKTGASYKELDMSFVEFWAPFAESCIYVPLSCLNFDRPVQSGQITLENTQRKDCSSSRLMSPRTRKSLRTITSTPQESPDNSQQ